MSEGRAESGTASQPSYLGHAGRRLTVKREHRQATEHAAYGVSPLPHTAEQFEAADHRGLQPGWQHGRESLFGSGGRRRRVGALIGGAAAYACYKGYVCDFRWQGLTPKGSRSQGRRHAP